MFNLHDFVLSTVMGMVGREPDYKVQEYALGWYSKSQLTTEDLSAVDAAIKEQYPVELPEELPLESVEEVK